MCGIAGLVYSDRDRPCEAETIIAMRDVMRYRGPDDEGLHLDGPLGLGFRRLSIIDLSGGHQPMTDVSQRYWIIFNGEIYNYRSLRQQLIEGGAPFRTHSDTEVILQLYAQLGERCVDRLNGMFAFAIWDRVQRSLFLARDRMGVKPLYYVDTPDGFAFSSEVKSLFPSGLVRPVCREEALAEYLVFRQVAGDETLFRSVKRLPPGCTMTIVDGRLRLSRYWSPRPATVRRDLSYEDALDTFESLIDDSVRMRLVSDVPVGTFCSGGVDSSLVTALAVRHKADRVNTFSIGFDEPDFDESAEALAVSHHCGTEHHRLNIGNVEFDRLLPEMVWHNDEPLDFANSIQIFALSELAKATVTVVLTGEGSDELFGGYPRYRIPEFVDFARLVPAPLRRAAMALTGDHRIAKLDRYAACSSDDVLLLNCSYNRQEQIRALCPALPAMEAGFRRECVEASAALGLDPLSRLTLLDQETFLLGILNRQDKMSMAASIESRVPFMDFRIVEFANALPAGLKVREGSGKALVKAVARKLLPPAIVDRRKSGFGVPLARWFREDTGLGMRLASLPGSAGGDLFDRAMLGRLVQEHRSGSQDHSELLWTALNVMLWLDAFGC